MRYSTQFIVKLSIVIILFVTLFSYAMFQGGFVSWFLFYGFLPFLIYMACLLVYPIHQWEVERHLSKSVATGGETIDVEVTLTRNFPFPLYYCVIEEYFPDSLKRKDTHLEKFRHMDKPEDLKEQRRVTLVSFPWFKKKIEYSYSLERVPRGEHDLKSIRVKTGDFFGFVKREFVYETEQKLLVFPYKRKLNMIEMVYSFEQGASPSFRLNEKNSNVVTGVRDYMPGDKFAWIDWKTTAKKNEMMTKEFEQEKSADILVILDAVYHPSMNPLAFEGAVEFTASLLDELHKQSSQLAFMTLGDGKQFFPFQQDYKHKQMIQRQLAKIRPLGRVPFAQQLDRERTQLPSGMITMIISHHLDAQTEQALHKLAQKSRKLLFFYLRPQSQMSFQDHQLIKALKHRGVVVNVLSEEHLIQEEFGVNT
ncbi:DUF58 domain-containing protein [Halobacillus salinarum]|uniref:DUF58 domain-containing protein n=1 Tax=Halobacillus salinarum TaxID=2932257 RepID=A0ABY4EJ32_9BACI|nr:DUF58 domain-containing protein [Halobacillus salinarum]UOQ44101.1 DUF58 domain-containing protein [Halobacillus salinarum]